MSEELFKNSPQDQFKHLRDQCWICNTHPDMIDEDCNGNPRPCGFDSHKFAELIVRECISQARTQMFSDDEIANEEDPLIFKLSQAYNVGIESAVEEIQEYFGAKE